MARIRSIHPGFFTDERLVGISMSARMLLIGLGVEADDKGIFEWKPLTLKMRIFPAEAFTVDALLDELSQIDAIKAYEIDDRKYGAIRNFRKFQKPKTPNDVHPMPSDFRKYVGLKPVISETDDGKGGAFPQKGEKPNQMEDGGGSKEEEQPPQSPPKGDESGFEDFWKAYPTRSGSNPKKPAEAAWSRAIKRGGTAEQLLEAAKALAASYRDRTGEDRRFVPQAVTWLNQDRWQESIDPMAPKPGPDTFQPPSEGEKLADWLKGGKWSSRDGPPPDSPDWSGCARSAAIVLSNRWATGRDRRRVAALASHCADAGIEIKEVA